MVQTNGLGGGTFTEYLSLGSGTNAPHNLEGQPFIALGQPKRTRASFGDDALHSSTDLVSTYSYHVELIDGLAQTSQVETKQGATDVARKVYTYTVGTLNSLPTLSTTAVDSVSSTQTLTTTTRAYSRRIADPDLRGKILAVTRPDGTKTAYAYQRGTLSGSAWSANPAGQHILVAELNGKTGTSVSSYGSTSIDSLDLDANRSTVTERILDVGGRLLREASYVYQGGSTFTLLDATYHGYDAFGQLLIKADQPITGGAQAGRILYEAAYTGFQKQWERDAQGITTIFTYDAYGRVATKKRQGAAYGGHSIADAATTYTYDASGRLSSETQTGVGATDRLVSTYTYDTASRPKSQTAPGGFTTLINYDSLTQKTITLPGGGTRVESVYKDGRPKSVSGSAVPDSTTSYTFLSTGFLKTTSTTAGQTVVENKDWLGRVDSTETATWNSATRIAKNNYNTLGQLASQDVKVNNVKVALSHLYQYDSYGRLYREGLDADNNGALDPTADFGVKEYENQFQTGAPGYATNVYLYAGQKVWPYAGANASTSRYASQTYTQVTGLTSSLVSHTVVMDADRNKTDSTQTLNRASKLLETSTTTAGTNQTILQKNLNGLVVSTTNAQGHVTLQTYDGLGRPEATDDPRIGTTTVDYVVDSTLVYSVMAPDWKTTYSSYDSSGRLASQTDSAGKTAWFKYDAAGNLTHTWGDTTNPVKYEYNELGQRTVQRTYRSGTWTGASLPGGFAGTGDVTTWNYQPSTGLLTSKVDSAGTTSFEYDQMGRVNKRTDARGWVTNYTFTSAGLPWVTDYQDSFTPDVTYTYDRAGRVATVTDGTGNRSFSYYDSWSNGSYEAELRNKSARLQTETFTSGFYGGGRSVTYDYQYEVSGRANGPQLSLKIDNGSLYTVGYAYDAVGRLNSVSYNAVTPFSYGYMANSNLVDTVAQSTTGYKRDYDYEAKSDRVETLKNQWAAITASTVESRLTYDLLGRRNTEKLAGTGWMTALGRGSEPGVHLDYTYTDRSEVDSSARYQLTAGWGVGAFRPGTDRDYTYDAMGNRTADIIAGMAGSYSPNGLNQYSSAPGMASSSYDANGNLTSDGTRTYEYDGENRLIKITQGGSVWNYAYDYLGRRVRKWGSGIPEQRFIYDGWNLIGETDAAGNLTRRYAWGLDVSGTLQGAGGVGGLLLIQDGGSTYYPLYDASHNVIGLYNASGALDSAYEYDPFGRSVTATGTYAAANPFRFSTKYTDNETSLVYYGYRYYSPLLGRFINRDPIGEEGGINLYAFCGNDGVNGWDYLAVSMQ